MWRGVLLLTNIFAGAIIGRKFGLVAQLGAHRIRIAGVGSSNLLKSTNKKDRHKAVFFIGK